MKSKRPFGAALRPIFLAALSLPMACSAGNEGASEKDSEAAAEPAAAPPAPESQIPTGSFVGNVVETMDAGTYTYVALERAGEQIWAAGPKTAVAVGEEITVGLDMRMDGFESETLSRRFETIYFVTTLGPGSAPTGHGTAEDPHAELPQFQTGKDPHAGLPQFQTGKDATEIDLGSIDKPEGAHRVAELWDQRGELTGQEVVVRGRVVKYNAGILGRNWLHVQDGSGDSGTGSHDLTVTTQAPSAVGDLVTVRGVVAVDQDFGAGYSYALIVEEATVQVE